MTPQEPKLLTIKQVASMLCVTTLTIRNWDKKGKLIALRHPLNNYRVYRREDIERLLEEISTNTVPIRPPKKAIRKLEIKHLTE